MRLRVLGCHGGESPAHRNPCFMLDGNVLVEAGSLTRGLTLAEQTRIDHVLVSHAHLDHVHDLAFLADNVIMRRKAPVEIYASSGTIDVLERHFFNGALWPDFTKLPTAESPTIRLHRVPARERVQVGSLRVRLVPVHHTVECHGMILEGKDAAIAVSGDTGPTDELWQTINETPNVRAVLCEVSFPNELEQVARLSGHLTPKLLTAEIDKLRTDLRARILLYHMKPAHQDAIKAQLAEIGDPRMVVLKPMDDFEL